MSPGPVPLRLTALDVEDLEPVSAALQDAVAQLGDFEYSSQLRSFTIAFNRYCWETGGPKRRVRCGVQFANVTAAKSQNIRQGADDAVVNLLSINFEPGEMPSGEIILVFSGGGELRLEAECLEVVLADISQPWAVKNRPKHTEGPL